MRFETSVQVFLLLFYDLNLVRIHYFAVMVTVMQFLQFFTDIKKYFLKKAFTIEKKVQITFLLLFYYFFMTKIPKFNPISRYYAKIGSISRFLTF